MVVTICELANSNQSFTLNRTIDSLYKITVFSEVEQSLVEHLDILGVASEGEAVSSFGVPGADSEQTTVLILRHQVLQNRAIIDERVQLSKKDNPLYEQYLIE